MALFLLFWGYTLSMPVRYLILKALRPNLGDRKGGRPGELGHRSRVGDDAQKDELRLGRH